MMPYGSQHRRRDRVRTKDAELADSFAIHSKASPFRVSMTAFHNQETINSFPLPTRITPKPARGMMLG
jgi:hypothetical protein